MQLICVLLAQNVISASGDQQSVIKMTVRRVELLRLERLWAYDMVLINDTDFTNTSAE